MAVDILQDDLIRFATPTPDDPDAELAEFEGLRDAVPKVEETPPPVSGPCHVCNERAAVERCRHCGLGACRHDFWTMFGLCKKCATEEEVRKAREGADRKLPELGIKWIEGR